MDTKKALVLLFILALTAESQYQDLLTLDFPSNATSIEYSGDHKYMGVTEDWALSVFDGHTGDILQKILVREENKKISSFAFSGDGHSLILGMNDGCADLYFYSSQDHAFIFTNQSYVGDLESSINSICFGRYGSLAILGQINNNFIVWDTKNNQFFGHDFSDQFVFAVACSSQNGLFAVGGGSGSSSKLTLFQAAVGEGQISVEIVHDFEMEASATVFGLAFSSSSLLSVGKNNYISSYDL